MMCIIDIMCNDTEIQNREKTRRPTMYSEVQREIAIDEELDGLIDKFINVHLPKYRGCSKHTIKSYETAICQFLSWVSDIGGSISQESKSIGVLDFNRNQITEWLYFIEERGCCAATRNQRLAALRSFFYSLQIKIQHIWKITTPLNGYAGKKHQRLPRIFWMKRN